MLIILRLHAFHCNSICLIREYISYLLSRAKNNILWAPVLTYVLKCTSIIIGRFNLEFSHVSMTSSLIFLFNSASFKIPNFEPKQLTKYINIFNYHLTFSSDYLDLRSLSRRAINLKNPPTSPPKSYFWANLPSIIS